MSADLAAEVAELRSRLDAIVSGQQPVDTLSVRHLHVVNEAGDTVIRASEVDRPNGPRAELILGRTAPDEWLPEVEIAAATTNRGRLGDGSWLSLRGQADAEALDIANVSMYADYGNASMTIEGDGGWRRLGHDPNDDHVERHQDESGCALERIAKDMPDVATAIRRVIDRVDERRSNGETDPWPALRLLIADDGGWAAS